MVVRLFVDRSLVLLVTIGLFASPSQVLPDASDSFYNNAVLGIVEKMHQSDVATGLVGAGAAKPARADHTSTLATTSGGKDSNNSTAPIATNEPSGSVEISKGGKSSEHGTMKTAMSGPSEAGPSVGSSSYSTNKGNAMAHIALGKVVSIAPVSTIAANTAKSGQKQETSQGYAPIPKKEAPRSNPTTTPSIPSSSDSKKQPPKQTPPWVKPSPKSSGSPKK
jgi:hypothetical protein